MTEADSLVSEVKALAGSFDEKFFELGHALRRLQKEDKAAFRQTVKDAGIGERKAYYLTRIVKAFAGLPVPRARLKKIGWTKLKTLSGHIDASNYAELLRQAQVLTDKKLEAYLQGAEIEQPTKAVLMYLTKADNAEFERALSLFGGTRSHRGMLNREEAVLAMTRWVLDRHDAA